MCIYVLRVFALEAFSAVGLRNYAMKRVLQVSTTLDALSFSPGFPFATQLRCFIHLRRNVETKLREIGFPSHVLQEYVADIFGK